MDEEKALSYRTVLRKEPEGGYTVIVPSLPGCVTYGGTVDHAITMAKEAAELYAESLEAHGEDILDEQETWFRFAAAQFQAAYGENEPEYTLDLIQEPNPEYKP